VTDTKSVPRTLFLLGKTSSESPVDSRAGKYLVFDLGREEYGIRVAQVREITGLQNVTAVPHAPDHIKGVINLRGKVIPVMDLRLKFGMPTVQFAERTCIIVAQLQGAIRSGLMGIVVDGVAEVVSIAGNDIEDTPKFGQGPAAPYLLGIAKIKGKVKILLDVDEMLSGRELSPREGACGAGERG